MRWECKVASFHRSIHQTTLSLSNRHHQCNWITTSTLLDQKFTTTAPPPRERETPSQSASHSEQKGIKYLGSIPFLGSHSPFRYIKRSGRNKRINWSQEEVIWITRELYRHRRRRPWGKWQGIYGSSITNLSGWDMRYDYVYKSGHQGRVSAINLKDGKYGWQEDRRTQKDRVIYGESACVVVCVE